MITPWPLEGGLGDSLAHALLRPPRRAQHHPPSDAGLVVAEGPAPPTEGTERARARMAQRYGNDITALLTSTPAHGNRRW